MSAATLAPFVLLAALAGATAAFAQDTPAQTPAVGRAAASAVQREAGDRYCVRSTGSRIPARPGRCLPVAGRSYGGDELQRTGAIDTAHALQMLDPGIRIAH